MTARPTAPPSPQTAAGQSLGAMPCSWLPVPFYRDEYVTIYHADCRQILPMLGRFDLLMADPPYGIGEAKGRNKTRSCLATSKDYGTATWDDEPVEEWVMSLARSICQKQIIFGGNYYALPPCKGPLVWDKENGENDFADGELAWNNLGTALRIKRHRWHGMIRKGGEDRHHPTQKPLEVIQWAIQLAGDVKTILDPWAGSGTTGHAAKNLGKRAVLIEREERYCEIAAARLAQDVLPLHTTNRELSEPKSVDNT